MISILVILIVLALAALAFFKIPVLQGLATIVVALVSTFVAFGYHEIVGDQLAGFVSSLAAWAQAISFMLLFILVFAVLQTGVVTFLRGPIDLGQLAERIGRPICGLILGWIVAGVLVTALWLAPLSSEWPYDRYGGSRPNPDAAQGVLLNADGLVAGWFGMVSQGSLKAIRNPASFAVVRAGFLDQMAMNRLKDNAPRFTEKPALTAPKKNGVRAVSGDLVDLEGDTVSVPSGRRLMIIRLGIRKQALPDANPFIMGQVSVVCKEQTTGAAELAGQGVAVYPIGCLSDTGEMKRFSLSASQPIESKHVKKSQQWIDFVFPVPSDMTPVLARFKLNNAVTLSTAIDEEEAIEPSGYIKKRPRQRADDGASEEQATTE